MLGYRWSCTDAAVNDVAVLPQFKGTLVIDEVTGEYVAWSSPTVRHVKYVAGGLISFVLVSLAVTLQSLPDIYEDELEPWAQQVFGLGDKQFHGLCSLYTGLVVELVGGRYKQLALRLTTWENHRLASDFKQAANLKVFVFAVVNC